MEGEVDGGVEREGGREWENEAERGAYGEVILSARIFVSINSRAGVCLASLSGWLLS